MKMRFNPTETIQNRPSTPRRAASLALHCIGLLFALALAAPTLCTGAGEEPFTDEEMRNSGVIACWTFTPDDPAADRSGNGHSLKLRGKDTHFVVAEPWEGALELREETAPGDTRQGASAGNAGSLSPRGAFTLEMRFQPDPALLERPRAVLLDKKYFYGNRPEGNSDYLLSLKRNDEGGWQLEIELGFGKKTEVVRSDFFNLEADQWRHVAFTYDGQGACAFYLDGQLVGEKNLPGRTTLHPGQRPLIIGDRYGSLGARFLGKIAQVRLSSRVVAFALTPDKVASLRLQGERSTFRRMEEEARLHVEVTNRGDEALRGATLRWSEGETALPPIKAGESIVVPAPLDATRKPGEYTLEFSVVGGEGNALSAPLKASWTLVARPLPQRMPVILWGTGNTAAIRELGFTHYIALWQDSKAKPVAFLDAEAIRRHRARMDQLLKIGVGALAQVSLGRNPEFREAYGRVDRNGKHHPAVNGLFPEVQKSAEALGAFVGRNFGDLPAFEGVLVNTEVRDRTRPSFHELDREAYRAFSGRDIPPEVDAARGIAYDKLHAFPASRIIEDDHPILNYYRWFWKEGDGWNRLHSLVRQSIRQHGGEKLWTWFDPAVRAPSLFGSGGESDRIANWTYTYPDPLKLSLTTGELLAMAAGRPGQEVMTMTQAIWYRNRTAPAANDRSLAALPPSGEPVPWEREQPEARFITIAPDHLAEALWLMLAEPVRGVMVHGWGSLAGGSKGSYVMTEPTAKERLRSFVKSVIEPLGATLVQLPDAPRNVAFLESFTSQMFAGRGTYGWGAGWGADAYLIARYAGLDPRIVYEETILEQGLEGFSVLFLPQCDVLTRSVAAAIERFQDRGGIVIADELLAPAIQPDILLESFARSGHAGRDKKALLQKAQALQKELAGFHTPAARSDNPEIVLKRRGTGNYLFAINDHRTFGNYVGRHHLVMEAGVPSRATIRWEMQGQGRVVYDLLQRRALTVAQTAEGGVEFAVDLPPGGGALFLALERPVGELAMAAPGEAVRGGPVSLSLSLPDEAGVDLSAIVPMQLTIRDPQGNIAERSGYYGAVNGKMSVTLDLASNDLPGEWTIEAVEGLTGQRLAHALQVR